MVHIEPVSGKKDWNTATVIQETGKRSYKVRIEDGVCIGEISIDQRKDAELF